jgi:Flp pilus assembly protein TadB
VAVATALLAGLGVLAISLGLWQIVSERIRAPAAAVAEAAGRLESHTPLSEPRSRPHRRPLPWPLGYVERRTRTAGVEWDLATVLSLIVGSGVACGAAIELGTGVLWMAAIAGCMGFGAPVWQLGRLTARRSHLVLRQLDQVCTELIQAMSAGQDLYAALFQQAKRAPDPIGSELRRVMDRVRQGEPLADAMAELPDHVALEEARLFSVGVRLALDAGTRIIPVLESIQRSLRGRREMEGLVRELSVRNEKQSLILLAVPMVMLLAMRFEAPQYVAPLLATAAGQILLAADMLWLLLGVRLVRGFFSTTPIT